MKRVTGLGGIFFKSEDPQNMKDWYGKHLGLNIDDYGATFEWRAADDPSEKGQTLWSPFKTNTTYFAPSTKEYMINYRVENLEWLVDQLKKEGISFIDEMETYEYGKFIHLLDPEGNKIELWEPTETKSDQTENL